MVDLPRELGNLKKLEELWLQDNKLGETWTSVPAMGSRRHLPVLPANMLTSSPLMSRCGVTYDVSFFKCHRGAFMLESRDDYTKLINHTSLCSLLSQRQRVSSIACVLARSKSTCLSACLPFCLQGGVCHRVPCMSVSREPHVNIV